MRRALMVLFAGIFVAMTALTIRASLSQGILPAIDLLWPDPWFQVTLADCYFAFLAVWLWVAWRERRVVARVLWLVLFFTLGNFAISAYVLWQLWKLPADRPLGDLFRPLPATGD